MTLVGLLISLYCFQNEAPEPEPHCVPASVEKAKVLWRPEAMKAEPYIFTIEMHNIVPFGKLYILCAVYYCVYIRVSFTHYFSLQVRP